MARVIEERKEVEVYAGDMGHVCIKQNGFPDDDSIIIVHPDDVTKLIEYLQEAQAEAYLIRAASKA
jgi:uncharacterized protein YlxW (UPF0749 family)